MFPLTTNIPLTPFRFMELFCYLFLTIQRYTNEIKQLVKTASFLLPLLFKDKLNKEHNNLDVVFDVL